MTVNLDDKAALEEYSRTRSQAAFAQLVSMHADWMYSAALRMVRDPQTAQDVTQAAFILLAQQPRKAIGKSLAAWLFNVTRYCAANAMRAQARRELHERRAAAMVRELADDEERLWDDIAPMMDELIARLRSKDRQAVMLRFYQGKSMAEIGIALGVSEDAARKRVAWATEKLRGLLQSKGVMASVVGLTALMAAHTTQAAPAMLTAGLSAGLPPATGAAAHLVVGAKKMMLITKIKLAAAVAAAALMMGTGSWMVARGMAKNIEAGEYAKNQSSSPPAAANSTTAPTRIATAATAPSAADVRLDLSTPDRAMTSFIAALKSGDRDKTYDCLAVDPARTTLPIDAYMDLTLSTNRMLAAGVKAYGASAAPLQAGIFTLDRMGAIISAGPAQSGGQTTMTGDTAVLTPAKVPDFVIAKMPRNVREIVRLWSGAPMYFKKESGDWKLDIDRSITVVRGRRNAPPADMSKEELDQENTDQLEESAKAMDALADDIRSGKLGTVGNTQRALRQKLTQFTGHPGGRDGSGLIVVPAHAIPATKPSNNTTPTTHPDAESR